MQWPFYPYDIKIRYHYYNGCYSTVWSVRKLRLCSELNTRHSKALCRALLLKRTFFRSYWIHCSLTSTLRKKHRNCSNGTEMKSNQGKKSPKLSYHPQRWFLDGLIRTQSREKEMNELLWLLNPQTWTIHLNSFTGLTVAVIEAFFFFFLKSHSYMRAD